MTSTLELWQRSLPKRFSVRGCLMWQPFLHWPHSSVSTPHHHHHPPSSLPAEPRLLFLLMPSPAAVSMETPSYKLSDGASCLGLQEASGLHTCMKHMASFCVEHNAPLHPQPAASLLLLLHTYRFYFYKNLKSARIRCPLLNLSTTIPVFDEHVWVTSSPESFIPASEIWNVNIFWFIRH